uniref:Uncharacterized protein n=1 Tax=Coccidioides posadasii RMSCC 3488 TaxID=454284 RepID=A0A0J6IF31_COCPO|nr:hypothetical protein CPAG_06719 [Coccidioides posadasii RMSCC 3488]
MAVGLFMCTGRLTGKAKTVKGKPDIAGREEEEEEEEEAQSGREGIFLVLLMVLSEDWGPPLPAGTLAVFGAKQWAFVLGGAPGRMGSLLFCSVTDKGVALVASAGHFANLVNRSD